MFFETEMSGGFKLLLTSLREVNNNLNSKYKTLS